MEYSTVFLGWLGGQEILLLVLVVLIFFGGRKIPELMRGIGKGIKEFKSETKDKEDNTDTNTPS
ncbi:MAG: twin-arginine translocase TatA/TatE family subunit [Salinivirgaceae bacterium]|nr:twin-arginine translocase TatA/TatE family subunit [Salinivirgaceae bacterium]